MRVLLTGGAGFIGSHVADALVRAGHEVRILDVLLPAAHQTYVDTRPGDGNTLSTRLSAPPWPVGAVSGGDVELVVADVRDASAVDRALSGVDAVVHHAAMVGLGVDIADLPAYVGINDLGTAVLLAGMARAGVGRLVLASSMVVYGEGRYECPEHGVVRPGPRAVADLAGGRFDPGCPVCGAPLTAGAVTEDSPLDPRSVYAATKVAQEHLAAAWARTTAGAAVALRYHNVYGSRMPRDTPYAGVASMFRSELERGRPPRVFEDGRQLRDFVHVRDVAAANLAALDLTGRAGSDPFVAYNVASGEPHTVGEMAAALAEAFGGPAPVITGEYRLGDVRHVVAASNLARRDLGYTAQVGFVDGVKEFATALLRG